MSLTKTNVFENNQVKIYLHLFVLVVKQSSQDEIPLLH